MVAFVYEYVLGYYELLGAMRSSCLLCGLTLSGCVLSYAFDSMQRAEELLVDELWICKPVAFGGSFEFLVIGAGAMLRCARSIVLARFERCCRSMTSRL